MGWLNWKGEESKNSEDGLRPVKMKTANAIKKRRVAAENDRGETAMGMNGRKMAGQGVESERNIVHSQSKWKEY